MAATTDPRAHGPNCCAIVPGHHFPCCARASNTLELEDGRRVEVCVRHLAMHRRRPGFLTWAEPAWLDVFWAEAESEDTFKAQVRVALERRRQDGLPLFPGAAL